MPSQETMLTTMPSTVLRLDSYLEEQLLKDEQPFEILASSPHH
jgi:hypothetical protein